MGVSGWGGWSHDSGCASPGGDHPNRQQPPTVPTSHHRLVWIHQSMARASVPVHRAPLFGTSFVPSPSQSCMPAHPWACQSGATMDIPQKAQYKLQPRRKCFIYSPQLDQPNDCTIDCSPRRPIGPWPRTDEPRFRTQRRRRRGFRTLRRTPPPTPEKEDQMRSI